MHDNYTVTRLASNGLAGVYSAAKVKNASGNVTVALLPGRYTSGTTVYVYSSVDTIGLGDKETIIVEKASASDSNRHLFNLSNRDTEGYDYMTLRNMKLVVSANTTGNKDNAAVQVIGWTKAKCYDLIVEKTVSSGRLPFYINATNTASDGKTHPVYVYFENVVCVANTNSLFERSGTNTIRHHNLTYNNGSSTYTSQTRAFLDYGNWDW